MSNFLHYVGSKKPWDLQVPPFSPINVKPNNSIILQFIENPMILDGNQTTPYYVLREDKTEQRRLKWVILEGWP